jgi:hypothetical protein
VAPPATEGIVRAEDQAARHRADLEALVASHEAEAARYTDQPKGL